MKAKAIGDLGQLSRNEFFAQVAVGMELVLQNAERLWLSAEKEIDGGFGQAGRILEMFAAEEAAKFHILLDACRCPKSNQKLQNISLKRFNDHLAKGLYVQTYSTRPSSLHQLQEYVDCYRQKFYLDGPNDFDWIFRNEIYQSREGCLYVDYVVGQDGASWHDPGIYDSFPPFASAPHVLNIARYLHELGIVDSSNLASLAKYWEGIDLNSNLSFSDLCKHNEAFLQSVLSPSLWNAQISTVSKVIYEWQFPMFSLDMRLVDVDLDKLQETQKTASNRFYDAV